MGYEDLALHVNAHQRSCTLDEILNNKIDTKNFLFFFNISFVISHPFCHNGYMSRRVLVTGMEPRQGQLTNDPFIMDKLKTLVDECPFTQ